MKVRHLYVGDDNGPLVTAFCGWRKVAIWHTTCDWRRVTCNNCLGRKQGLTAIALRELEAAKGDE